ncbi:alpha/beta fold hydrolase [Cryptosporangium aurantiacum]|uniref:Alpha/beta hydrolase family protein n=1 Tax=Cryptosporangium aurantiacum TaxID=134849 RepID=A0A1M7KPV6_9ACTN|nr:alpha/beta fold hydrolase [Cryptosporangium aurantiacum]SHM67471.1 Alpha/beta hydrolase family protein [Cryptosporangium aurantiacum]
MTVLLVHGAGSTIDHNFRKVGWIDLLEAAGHPVIGYHLPGHGDAPPPDMTSGDEVVDDLLGRLEVDGPLDAVGFSAGAQLLAATAAREPARFRRLALLGVGNGVLKPNVVAIRRLADALADEDDPHGVGRLFRRMARSAGNDIDDVRRYLEIPKPPAEPDALAKVDASVLVVLGDKDFNAPADDLVAAFGRARLRMLPGVDHFGLAADVRCLEIVMAFLDGAD